VRHWWSASALAAVLLLAVWGCGGSDDGADAARSGSGTPAATAAGSVASDERQIREVADRFYDAYVAGDGRAACSLLSEAAERQVVEDPESAQAGSTCAARLAAAAAVITRFYGPDPEISLTDVKVTGDRATGVVHVAGQSEGASFVRENGEWRLGAEPG
jgi:hypothetical protein